MKRVFLSNRIIASNEIRGTTEKDQFYTNDLDKVITAKKTIYYLLTIFMPADILNLVGKHEVLDGRKKSSTPGAYHCMRWSCFVLNAPVG